MDRNLESIALTCVTECRRQHVGLDGLACLLAGYTYAADHAADLPSEGDLLHLIGLIEPTTNGRYRVTPVTFDDGGSGATASTVPAAVARMFGLLDADTDAEEFVHHLLAIHPFIDGNGRVAFVLLNWMEGRLDDPRPLPEFTFA